MNASLVLVIEDDEDIRHFLIAKLEQHGHKVVGAGTGEIGLELALANVPALVILDIMLPGMDGWEVARRLREDDRTAKVPVLVASILEPDDGLASHIQPTGYLPKPFKSAQITRMVSELVGVGRPPSC